MSWTSWAIFIIVTLGLILFLYGANTYDTTIGWIGVILFIGGIIFYFLIYIYGILKKSAPIQKQ